MTDQSSTDNAPRLVLGHDGAGLRDWPSHQGAPRRPVEPVGWPEDVSARILLSVGDRYRLSEGAQQGLDKDLLCFSIQLERLRRSKKRLPSKAKLQFLLPEIERDPSNAVLAVAHAIVAGGRGRRNGTAPNRDDVDAARHQDRETTVAAAHLLDAALVLMDRQSPGIAMQVMKGVAPSPASIRTAAATALAHFVKDAHGGVRRRPNFEVNWAIFQLGHMFEFYFHRPHAFRSPSLTVATALTAPSSGLPMRRSTSWG